MNCCAWSGCRRSMRSAIRTNCPAGSGSAACIARALASEPSLIIADEAVAALDVSIRAQVVNLLMELQARLGVAYLFISHDMAVVERVSHRVAVMYLGQIVEIGPRQAVFGDPQHAYTRRLLAAVPIPDPRRRDHSDRAGRQRGAQPVAPARRSTHRGAAGAGGRGSFRRPPSRRRAVLNEEETQVRHPVFPRMLLAASLALGCGGRGACRQGPGGRPRPTT